MLVEVRPALAMEEMFAEVVGLARAQAELEGEQLAAGGGGGVDEGESLTRDRVGERLAGSDHGRQAPAGR